MIIIVGALFIAREDFVSLIDKVSSSFNKNIKTPVIKLTEKENILKGKIDMPGALRVVDNIFGTNNVVLSKDQIILLTNQYRKENSNLVSLKENKKLDLSAEKKLEEMFTNQYFEHISPKTGKGVGELGEEAGYEYILIGENLAMGNFKDDKSLVDAWVASKGHRENIVNKHYTEIGVAVGKGKFEDKEVFMAVQHFGTPRSACPNIDQVLFSTITINQNTLKVMEDDLVLRLDNIKKGVISKGSTYNEQVDEYNALLNPYNNLIKDIKEKINIYNEQIRVFNTCLLSLNQ